MKQKFILSALFLATSMSLSAQQYEFDKNKLPSNSQILNIDKRIINGSTFTFVKYISLINNDIGETIFNDKNKVIRELDLPEPTNKIVGNNLNKLLNEKSINTIDVVIAFKSEFQRNYVYENSITSFDISTDGEATVIEGDIKTLEKNRQFHKRQVDKYRKKRTKFIKTLAKSISEKSSWNSASASIEKISDSADTLKISLNKQEIKNLVEKHGNQIAGIETQKTSVSALQDALVNSGLNPYSSRSDNSAGNGIGIYMSEGSCPNNNFITDYLRLAGTSGTHSQQMSTIIRASSADSFIYCRNGFTLPIGNDLNGSVGNPDVELVNYSAAVHTPTAEYLIEDRDFDNFVFDESILAVVAAGNRISDDGTTTNTSSLVRSPGKGLNVLTVGNHDASTNHPHPDSNHINSSFGHNKPDLTAPGTNIDILGATILGTSPSTAMASGFLANLLSKYSWLQGNPHLQKSFMLAGTVGGHDYYPTGPNTSNRGTGRLQFRDAKLDSTHTNYQGSFDYFASNDSNSSNGKIDRKVYLSGGVPVRVAFSWLNDGDYTYANRFLGKLGQDYDIAVYAPAPYGYLVASSASRSNPFEFVEFSPPMQGYYTVQISRHSHYDSSASFRGGLSIDWGYINW